MEYVCGAIGVLGVAFAVFVWWRYTSVARGARQRDEKIHQMLDPIGERLARKQPVSPDEVAALADRPQVRPMLYAMLKHYERLDLFPARYLDVKSQGEAQLAYWMMHPNELHDAPEKIELVETFTRQLGADGETGEFLVFRYKMAEGHWAARDGWILGMAGPFLKDDVPYSGIAGGFSRVGDKHGEADPNELVDWYIGMCVRKAG
jgi:hypothetical protein